MVKLLSPGNSHIFPATAQPKITVQRKPKPFSFRDDEKLLISRIARRERKTELGDGMKLSAHTVTLTSPAEIEIGVTDIRWSQMLGIRAANPGGSPREFAARKSVNVLLSKNFIISRDGYLLISNKHGYTTPLNGFVDSTDMKGDADSGLIVRTVLKELEEEYGIVGDPSMIRLHCVESLMLSSDISAVSVLGSVSLPVIFRDILEFQKGAKDAWENRLIQGIEHTADSLASAAQRFGEPLKGRLEAYLQTLLG